MKTASKTRLGFSVALIALATMIVGGILTRIPLFQDNVTVVSLAVASLGVVFLVIGLLVRGWAGEAGSDRGLRKGEDAEHHPLAFFGSSRYWGVILILVSGVTYGIGTYYRPVKALVAAARSNKESAKEPIEFPPMRLQGIVVRSGQSSAVIDGKTYFVGDLIGEITVAAIDDETVRLVYENQTEVLTFTNRPAVARK